MKFSPCFVLFLALSFPAALLQAQQPPPPQSETPATAEKNKPQAQDDGKKGKPKPIPSFLIIGTVFDEHALSFSGVQIRIRRTGEKKYEWEAYTNARGEFAVRVPPGHDYEVLVHIKKYKDQTQSVDSKIDVQQRLSIQMEPITPPKTGAKS